MHLGIILFTCILKFIRRDYNLNLFTTVLLLFQILNVVNKNNYVSDNYINVILLNIKIFHLTLCIGAAKIVSKST